MTAIEHAAPEAEERLDAGGDLPALHADLEEQRRFRVRQLDELGGATRVGSTRPVDDAREQVTFALRAAATSVLTDIDAALDRLERNCYGSCLRCGAAIPMERLQALPMASRCTTCQLAHEANRTSPTDRRRDLTDSQPHP